MLNVDERMVKNLGRTVIKHYMPKSPPIGAMKLLEVCDMTLSYLLDFKVYSGQPTPRQHEVGLAQAVVEQLLEPFLMQVT